MHNSTAADGANGPFWVVLGGSEAVSGIWKNQRPPNTAVGRYPFLLPIVVICKSYDDARSVDVLNAEIFNDAGPEDYSALALAIRTSSTAATLLTHRPGKMYAFRVASEPGIYVSHTWAEVERFAEFSGSKHHGFLSFVDALLYMIDKEPYRTHAAAAAPPSERLGLGFSTSGRGGPIRIPDPRIKVEPSGSALDVRAGSKWVSPMKMTNTAHVGTSARVPTASGSNARASSADADQLSAVLQLLFSGLPSETRALRSLVAPLPSQDPLAGQGPPLTFGQRADAFLRARDLPPSSYIVILQARLYSANVYAFGYTLQVELGWAQDDGVYLWDLIELPGV